jgi:hypothetical protein
VRVDVVAEEASIASLVNAAVEAVQR